MRHLRRLVTNVNRGWRGLFDAQRIESTPLLAAAEAKDNLWVTADTAAFRAHLRHVALRMGPDWGFKVVTDSELMVAWLASAKLEGISILDPEVAASAAPVSLTKVSLADLVVPPEVLIVVLGVKAARNSAMPEVLSEAITTRIHEDKPVWVIDQPNQRLIEGHRAFDYSVPELLRDFSYFALDRMEAGGSPLPAPETLTESAPTSNIPTGRGRRGPSFSNGSGSTTAAPVEAAEPNKSRGRGRWKGGKNS